MENVLEKEFGKNVRRHVENVTFNTDENTKSPCECPIRQHTTIPKINSLFPRINLK